MEKPLQGKAARTARGPLVCLLALLAACSSLAPGPAPETVFTGLERRLLEAPSLDVRFKITSEGVFDTSFDGTLRLTREPVTELQATGRFGDAPVTLRLRSDASGMEGGAGERTFREPAPPELREALVLGLTRMGVLHNLARLTGAAPPDHAAGGVREWVEVREIQRVSGEALKLAIHVAGKRAAEATLWLDGRTGLPVRREQVVTFPEGTMRVVEEYEFLDAPAPGSS